MRIKFVHDSRHWRLWGWAFSSKQVLPVSWFRNILAPTNKLAFREKSLVAHAISLPEVSEVIRVLAVDSNRMNSQLLATALERDKRFQVLDTLPDARGIVAAVAKERPGVVIMSAEIEGNSRKGFEVAREVTALRSATRVVMLLDSSERSQVVEAFRVGARGVFSRNESLKTLAKCLLCVSQG